MTDLTSVKFNAHILVLVQRFVIARKVNPRIRKNLRTLKIEVVEFLGFSILYEIDVVFKHIVLCVN